jgi:hypothetical protein
MYKKRYVTMNKAVTKSQDLKFIIHITSILLIYHCYVATVYLRMFTVLYTEM